MNHYLHFTSHCIYTVFSVRVCVSVFLERSARRRSGESLSNILYAGTTFREVLGFLYQYDPLLHTCPGQSELSVVILFKSHLLLAEKQVVGALTAAGVSELNISRLYPLVRVPHSVPQRTVLFIYYVLAMLNRK